MEIKEGTVIFLKNGDVFIVDNEMKTSISCTECDVLRFIENDEILIY